MFTIYQEIEKNNNKELMCNQYNMEYKDEGGLYGSDQTDKYEEED